MASTLHILAVLVAAVVLLVLRKRSRDAVKYANLPPGPAPELFFGNSRQIAPQYPWRQWYELSKVRRVCLPFREQDCRKRANPS